MAKAQLSVANDIKALALINIQDIFKFMLTATDEEIEDRYESEEKAINVAEKYLDIAFRVGLMEIDLCGWEMSYTMPVKNSDERRKYTAKFYNDKGENKAEHDGCEECKHIDCDEINYPCCDCKQNHDDLWEPKE